MVIGFQPDVYKRQADNAAGQTRGVIGHSGLVFFGSGSLCIFHALHELPVAGERLSLIHI